MQKYLEKIKSNLRKKEVIVVIVLTLIGLFLRAYHHQDWLHFQLDQSRDAYKVDAVIGENGSLAELPLVGPSARGTGLYLGPIFYYFQIFSGLFFGNYPDKLAYPDLIFSVLTIPLAYILFRKYFSKYLSLGLTSLVTFSLFLVKYGRFAWNPNSMPFFTVLGILAMLKSVDDKNQIKTNWFLLMIACFAIASQLHFIALLSLAMILIAYLAYKRPAIKIKHIVLSILMVLFLYAPMVVYEVQTKGDNTKNFFAAITKKKEKDSDKTLFEKTFRNLQESSRTYWIILSSHQKGSFVKTDHEGLLPEFRCTGRCDDEKLITTLQVLLFVSALSLLLYHFIKKEKNKKRKEFLFVMLVWMLAQFIVLIPLAYQISPRFYLVTAIPFIFLFGLLIDLLIKKVEYGKYLACGIITLIVLVNAFNTADYFNKMKIAKTEPSSLQRDLMVLKDEVVTLELIEITTDYMMSNRFNDGPIEFTANNRYARAIQYMLYMRHDEKTKYFKQTQLAPAENKNFYIITKTESDSEVDEEIAQRFEVTKSRVIGTFTVHQLIPRTQ